MSETGDPDRASVRPLLASELDLLVPDIEDEGAIESTAFLVGLSGRHAGKLFKVREGESILGRSSRSLVAFDEKAVSQRHARLFHKVNSCVIDDLGSTNGTYVNDVRISSPLELRAGDVVRIGKTTLGFLTDAEDDEQHTRALARATTGQMQLTRAPGGQSLVSATTSSAALAIDTAAVEPNGLDVALERLSMGWSILRRYWKLLAVGLFIGAALGGASIVVRPPKAVAEFRIFLKHQGQENVHGRFAVVDAEYFRFAIENFTSPELVRETMKALDMPTEPANQVLITRSNVVLTIENPGVYKGQYYDTSPEFAEKFLATHLHGYLEREISKSIRVLSSEVELLRKQYRENEQQLRATELKLQEFKEKHPSGLPVDAASLLEARADLQGRVVELRANLERYTQELAFSRKQYASGDALVARKVDSAEPYDAGLASARQRLAAARARGLTDEHPEIKQLVQEERSLVELQKRAVASEVTDTERRANRELSALGARVGQMEVLASSTHNELELVQGRLGEIEKIVATLPAVEATFAELSRSLSASQNLHQHLHEQLKAKELKLEFDRASVAGRYELLDRPSAEPVSWVKTASMRAGMGGALGFGLMAAIAALHFLIDYARTRRTRLTA